MSAGTCDNAVRINLAVCVNSSTNFLDLGQLKVSRSNNVILSSSAVIQTRRQRQHRL